MKTEATEHDALSRRLRAVVEQRQVKPASGQRLGSHTLLEEIGKGHFSCVWKAHDGRKTTAVKLFCADAFPDVESRRNAALTFWRGARAMSKLPPNAHIVPVIDDPTVTGSRIWFAMDFFPDENLGKAIREGSLNETERLSVVDQLLESLDIAHQSEMLHGDVRPENILLFRRGDRVEARLADFDLGYHEYLLSAPGLVNMPSVTRYLPPDVSFEDSSRALALLRRTSNDLYAACVVIFEMFAGTEPGVPRGKSAGEIASLLPPSTSRSIGGSVLSETTRKRVAAVCSRGLEPLASARFRNLRELRHAWRQSVDGSQGVGAGGSHGVRGRFAAILIALSAVLVGSLVLDLEYHRAGASSWLHIFFDTTLRVAVTLGVTTITLRTLLKQQWSKFHRVEAWLGGSALRFMVTCLLATSAVAAAWSATHFSARGRQHRVAALSGGACWPEDSPGRKLKLNEVVGPEVIRVRCEHGTDLRLQSLSWFRYDIEVTEQSADDAARAKVAEEERKRVADDAVKPGEKFPNQGLPSATSRPFRPKTGTSSGGGPPIGGGPPLVATPPDLVAGPASGSGKPSPVGPTHCKAVDLKYPTGEYDAATIAELANECTRTHEPTVTIGSYRATCICR